MRIKYFAILVTIMSLFFGACGVKKEVSHNTGNELPTLSPKPMLKGGEELKVIPNATIFKMNGDYADNVGITLNEDGSILYYPDPKDITGSTSPYPIGNGWYLNRQGLSNNSVFTTFTFDKYRNLQTPPSHKELIESIIPGSGIEEFVEIPLSISDARNNPEACRKFIPNE